MLTAAANSTLASLAEIARRRLVRDGTWVLAGHATTALAGLASIRIFTELAPQAVFGAASLLLGMLTLGMHSLVAPITQTQIRYHTAYEDIGAGDRYTWLVARLAAAAALALAALVSTTLLVWPQARAGAGPGVIGWLAAWAAVAVYRGVLINRVQAERRQSRYAAWVGTEAVLMMGSTALALLAWPTIEGYIAGQTAGIALAALAFGRLKRAAGPGRPDLEGRLRRDAWRQITSYGLPFAALGLLGWLSNLSERYVLAATLDAAAVGQYVAAFSIASRPPTMVAGLLTDILRPEMFEAENRREGARARRAYFAWLAVQASAVALTSLAFLAFGTEIAALLLAESYRHGAPAIMGWIAIGYGFLAMAQAVENRVLSRAASRRLVLPKLAGAGANLALAIVLIPKFGVTGAAQANAFGQLLYLAGTLLAARELTRD